MKNVSQNYFRLYMIMKPQTMSWFEKVMLRKRFLIETVFHYLKNKSEIEYTGHQSISNAFVHILSTLVVYCSRSTKPSIKNNVMMAS